MIDPRDLNTYTQVYALNDGAPFGSLICNYEVRRYEELRNLDHADAYLVTCTTRCVVPNRQEISIKPGSIDGYYGYPALLSSKIDLGPGEEATTIAGRIRTYDPRSLNTAVTTDLSGAVSSSNTASYQHASGSTNSQTNSFNYSLTSFGGSTSTTASQSQSDSESRSAQVGRQQGESDSMSVKDWGSYAQLSADYSSLRWVWGQEYPWNTLQYKTADAAGNIVLPDFVQQRLVDNGVVLPPSELSLFGIDFIAHVTWLVHYTGDPLLQLNHTIDYVTASHGFKGTKIFSASMNAALPKPLLLTSDPIDMERLALGPLQSAGARRAAVIGFQADLFRVQPVGTGRCSILSRYNDLLARGQGFGPDMTVDLVSGTASLDLHFKVLGQRVYRLYLRHWISDSNACELTLTMPDGTSLVKYIDAKQSQGGEDNVLRIDLRDNRYASSSYHDYLVLGENVISMQFKVADPSAGRCSYTLSALAIG